MRVAAPDLHAPPLESPKEGAGAPPGGYLDPHIKLKQKTRRTEAVDEALYRRGHARTAFGTVADYHICHIYHMYYIFETPENQFPGVGELVPPTDPD